MLYKQNEYKDSALDIQTYEFSKDPQFNVYIQSLSKMGYFGDEKEGSARYKQLSMDARKEYIQRLAALKQEEDVFTKMKRVISEPVPELESIVNTEAEDSLDWMFVDPDSIEQEIQREESRGGMEAADVGLEERDLEDLDEVERKEVRKMEKMLSTFHEFMNGESGLEGVDIERYFTLYQLYNHSDVI